jgi:hypothetical protein
MANSGPSLNGSTSRPRRAQAENRASHRKPSQVALRLIQVFRHDLSGLLELVGMSAPALNAGARTPSTFARQDGNEDAARDGNEDAASIDAGHRNWDGNEDAASIDAGHRNWYHLTLCQERRESHQEALYTRS